MHIVGAHRRSSPIYIRGVSIQSHLGAGWGLYSCTEESSWQEGIQLEDQAVPKPVWWAHAKVFMNDTDPKQTMLLSRTSFQSQQFCLTLNTYDVTSWVTMTQRTWVTALFLLKCSQRLKEFILEVVGTQWNSDTARGVCQKDQQSETQLLLHADALVSWRADMTFKNRKKRHGKGKEGD